jgi:hypothetical protein
MKAVLSKREISVFLHYSISGGIAAATHFGLLTLLVELVAINPTFASAIGFCIALLVNYSLQYHWTLITLGINIVLFWALNSINQCYTFAIYGSNRNVD